MPDDPQQTDRKNRFLTEFKRRKVGRVISVYAAAAFVTLELVSIVAPSLGLPEWTMKVVIILLSAGFVIVAVLAWIFDRHPEGGLVRTPDTEESLSGTKLPQEKPGTTNRWKLATYISLALIVILALYHILTVWLPEKRDPANTIAVLPFRNDSPDREKDYIVNGLLEAILNNLAKVEDMHVVSRTSIETYRESSKSAREIGEELRVNYILEGSATIIDKQTRIYLQLIETSSDRHLWSSPFQREITLENLFDVQSEVALAVAGELQAILTPEEKEGIEKKPSENPAATNLYLQARNYLNISEAMYESYPEEVEKARQLLKQAITLDPDFADAYAWLGDIYMENIYRSQYYGAWDIEAAYACMDTGLVFVEKALSFESKHPVALFAQATYFQRKGNQNRARSILEHLASRQHLTYLYYEDAIYRKLDFEDYYGCIESYFRYLELRPPEVVTPYRALYMLYRTFRNTGYYELAEDFALKMLSISKDTTRYLGDKVNINNWKGNYPKAIEFALERWDRDTTIRNTARQLLSNYLYLEDTVNAINSLRKLEIIWAQQGVPVNEISPWPTLGYAYWLEGNYQQAERHYKGTELKLKKHLELNTPDAQRYHTHLVLSMLYAISGDDEKALQYLALMKNRKDMDLGYVNDLKNWPPFRSIQSSPVYIEVVEHLEKVCAQEYSRIGRLLEKNRHLLDR